MRKGRKERRNEERKKEERKEWKGSRTSVITSRVKGFRG